MKSTHKQASTTYRHCCSYKSQLGIAGGDLSAEFYVVAKLGLDTEHINKGQGAAPYSPAVKPTLDIAV
jgi:hypothetical protein